MITDLMAAKELLGKLQDSLLRCKRCSTLSAEMIIIRSGHGYRPLGPDDTVSGCALCGSGERERLVDWLARHS